MPKKYLCLDSKGVRYESDKPCGSTHQVGQGAFHSKIRSGGLGNYSQNTSGGGGGGGSAHVPPPIPWSTSTGNVTPSNPVISTSFRDIMDTPANVNKSQIPTPNLNAGKGKDFNFGKSVGEAAKGDPGMFTQFAQGLAKTGKALIGGGKRRREQARANRELKQRKQAYEDFEMENVYEDLTNTYEDLKVNTQQAEFEAQQSQQGLANTLGSLGATAGGSGIAALAQTLAGQQAMNIQRAGASIGMQESRNELRRASGAGQVQMQKAAGEKEVQEFELGRTVTLLDQAAVRKNKADAARKEATDNLVGGIADTVTGAGRIVAAVYTGGGSEVALSAGKAAAKKIAADNLKKMAKKGINEVGNYAIDKAGGNSGF